MPNRALGSVLRKIRRLIAPPEGGRVSDRQLLERFASGREEGAFAELVARHGPMVFGLCRRVLEDEHDAHDAFQAAFLVLVRKAGSVSWDESVAGWLYRVAHRAALKIKTSAARRRQHEREASDMVARKGPPAATLGPESQAVLDEELSNLPEKYRAPLVLCYLHGKTSEEAARELGWPAGSMSRRLAKGRELLRSRLARRGVALALPVLLPLLGPERMLAAVPAALAEATVKSAVTAGFSAAASTVADALVKEMFVAKLKIAAAVALAVGAAGAGALIGVQSLELSAKSQSESALGSGLLALDSKQERPPRALDARVLKLPHLDVQITALAVFRDSRHFASGGTDSVVRLWTLPPGKDHHGKEYDRLTRPVDVKGGTSRIAFSSDGHTFATAGDGSVRLWTIGQAKETRHFAGAPGGVSVLAFTPGGESLLFTSAGGALRLVEIKTDHPGWTVSPPAPVDSAAFSPDGKLLATAEGDGQVALREPATGRELRRLAAGQTVFSGSQAVAFAPDGKLATASMRDGSVRIWDPESGQELQKLGGGRDGMVVSVCFLGKRPLLAAAAGETIRVFDVAAGKEVYRLTAGLNPRCPLAASPDGKTLLAGGREGTIFVWEIPSDH